MTATTSTCSGLASGVHGLLTWMKTGNRVLCAHFAEVQNARQRPSSAFKYQKGFRCYALFREFFMRPIFFLYIT